MRIPSTLLLLLAGFLSCLTSVSAQEIPDNMLQTFEYREIGPTRQSGRFVDFAVVESAPKVYYAATASGGLWKTYNNGISWHPIFDDQAVISIGDVTVAPSDSSIVWVGTGEANNSRSSYWGNGVYKSTDGGQSWEHMGLEESHHIGRVIIHPENPNVVYIAALGHLYSDNPERGLYKTTDGGQSWTKVLDIEERGKKIGVVDAVMHPDNPDVLFAATFDKIRTPWTYNPGGPGSAVYMSSDGGAKWKKVKGGLPTGFLGRIGLDISKSNPDIMYANIENVNVEGMKTKDRLKQLTEGMPLEKGQRVVGDEMWRSDDGGKNWRKVSPDSSDVGGGPAYYYQQVRINPQDPEHVYVLGQRMWETVDGGKNWRRPFNFGGDNHAMWINPKDPKHMLLGYDHGMGVTYDGGQNWYHPDDQPLAQFYAVGLDMEYPYNIYGGLQDNGSVKGPSTKRDGSPIRLEDWKRVGGGDGMYNEVDPSDSRWLYNESQFGPLTRIDQVTGKRKSIAYRNQDRKMRWNWCAPILISPHNSSTIYHAGNKVVKSTNRGESWKVISEDLTTQDSAKIIGTGNIQYCTITTIDESPLKEGVIWVGTDDGNVQLTKDGGKNWTLLNDKITGNPGYWVSRVTASHHHPGKAYLTYTGYRRDDFRAFVFVTEDYGETWTSLSGDLPDESVNVIREDPVNPNLLFVGTDMGVYGSIDGGKNWTSMRLNMPYNPVHDLKIHPREHDLVVATHGRGIFITNIRPLQEWSAEAMKKPFHFYNIRSKVQWISPGDNNSSYNNFEGESEPLGLELYYHSNTDQDTAMIEVLHGELVVNELKAPIKAGMNKVVWDLQKRQRERTEKEKKQMMDRVERFRAFVSAEQIAAMMENIDYMMTEVQPGTYTFRITVDGTTYTQQGAVLRDVWFDK
jgi:photosystem II stability/assembly factor-like uncharacterized protein